MRTRLELIELAADHEAEAEIALQTAVNHIGSPSEQSAILRSIAHSLIAANMKVDAD
jgi:hypothetical protein